MKKVLFSLFLALPLAALAQPVVVAERGGAKVTMADVDTRMSEIPADKREGFIDSPERIEAMVSQLLLVKQLAIEARREGLENDPEYQTKLALAQERLLAEARMRQLANLPLPGDMDKAAREIYLAHPERFETGEVSVVRHLIAKTKPEAEALLARAQKGESFEALVRAESQDRQSAANGGLLEIGKNPQMIPEVLEAAREMSKPGELRLLETRVGPIIVEFVERRPNRKLKYEEVKSLLVNEAGIKVRDDQIRGHMNALTNKPITADQPTVASLRTRYKGGQIPPYGK